jgi:hypothetical protein
VLIHAIGVARVRWMLLPASVDDSVVTCHSAEYPRGASALRGLNQWGGEFSMPKRGENWMLLDTYVAPAVATGMRARPRRGTTAAAGSTAGFRLVPGPEGTGQGIGGHKEGPGPNTERSAGRTSRQACGGTGTRRGSAR